MKLYNKYKLLKEKEDVLYLFKVGIFYCLIDEDAKKYSKLLNLKTTPLNESIDKCGFPINSLNKYENILKENKIKYKIIDDEKNIKKILEKIKKLDVNNTTGSKALKILEELKECL